MAGKPDVHGGGFYGITRTGRYERVDQREVGAPDVWICRRTADFAPGQLPAAAAFAHCAICRACVVFNPARTVDAPKVCMQCAHLEPLPIEG